MTAAVLLVMAFLQTLATPAVQPETLVDDVRKLESADSNEARFDALTAILRARNIAFEVQPFTLEKAIGKEPRTEGRNVVASFGIGPEEIVVGAHFDAARLADGSLSRGAVDNAASSIILVRLAEALAAEKLPLRVRVVWFDMEELGLIGSRQYVKQNSARIVGMLNFDINAYGDTILFGPSEREDTLALRRSLLQTCAAQDIGCVRFAQMPPGDDRSFVGAGIPALSIGMLPALEAHQLWLMMNGGANSGLAQGMAPDDPHERRHGGKSER
jgi:peptidase M28-like protein